MHYAVVWVVSSGPKLLPKSLGSSCYSVLASFKLLAYVKALQISRS